ncbi:MAG: hypothetical protein GXY83_29500 [Rhodopirellula sp.]|nr:hypothetical protein [Rhodopirellula sp.]
MTAFDCDITRYWYGPTMRLPCRFPDCGVIAAVGLLIVVALPTPAPGRNGQLQLTVTDRESGKAIPCRMHLQSANGKPRKAEKLPFWNDHFVLPGRVALSLPVGNYTFEIERGPEYVFRGGHFTINDFADDARQIDLFRFVDMAGEGWWSGDLDVRRSPEEIELLMLADDLHVVPLVTWWNRENPWKAKPPADVLVRFDGNRYCHLMAGGHARDGGSLLYFNLPAPLLLDTNDPEYPPPTHFIERARQTPDAWIDVTRPYWWDLPMLVAHGQVDSIQILHGQICRDRVLEDEAEAKPRDKTLFPGPWGNALWSQAIYFHLLNCGLRIPPTAGSGSGISPNPLGYNRVYVAVEGEFDYRSWWQGLAAGRVFVTNGPLLKPSVAGHPPGHVFRADQGGEIDLEIGLTLWNRHPADAKESIHYLEIIQDGRIEHSVRFEQYANSGKLPKLHFDQSGWFLVRAVTDVSQTYRCAMTGPYYVEIGERPRISKASAQFFLDWIYERARRLKIDYPDRHREVLQQHRQARDWWQDRLERATAD